jgi:O-antigen/teichoic acid export membrane protein
MLAVATPRVVLRLAFGGDKTHAAAAFAPLALGMGCLAVSVLCTHYLLGVGERRVVAVLAGGVAVLGAALLAANGHAVPTARAELLCQGSVCLLLFFLTVGVSRRRMLGAVW